MSEGERLFKHHAAGSKDPTNSTSESCCPLNSLSLEESILELLETLRDILQWSLSTLKEKMSERINNLDGQVASLENQR